MLNIYQRINEIRKEVAYVQKDALVQGYYAVTHDQVTSAVRNAFIKHGVVTVPRAISSSTEPAGETSRGAPIIRYEGRFDVDFVNEEWPEDCVTVTLDAHANDTSDKAPGKALSYAVKYAILKVLNLETGEDDEGRTETFAESQTITDTQQLTLKAKIETAGKDMGKFLKWAKVDALDQITQKAFPLCVRTLDAAIEAAEAEKEAPKEPL